MEHQFLPNRLREILSEAGMPAPELALRAGNCPDSDSPGETYLINSGNQLLVFSRVMGENDYKQWGGHHITTNNKSWTRSWTTATAEGADA